MSRLRPSITPSCSSHSQCSTLALALLFLVFILSCTEEQKRSLDSSAPVAENTIKLIKIDPAHSNIFFNNQIKENKRLNYFIWNFIYQGAGVAIGDINNDQLPDIYLSGNMVTDKLYLNKGDFVFEDISQLAGIEDRLWSTGVSMVDINADGYLDIYVCKNFFLLQDGVRKNKLFINNGDLTFTEKSAEYGLDDAGFSVQSSFLDIDNDGDLDMYLVNQPMDQYAAALGKAENIARMPYSDKIFINNNGRYVDRTNALSLNNRRYGLNVLTADFTGNGRSDIYVCNDYNKGDQFIINKGAQRLEDEIHSRLDHTSFYSMGSDAADINNDGWLDFITLDMAFGNHYRSKTNMESMRPELFWRLVEEGEHFQYAVNNLQLNHGQGYFSDIAHLAGVSHTDWSWAPLFEDLDNDGRKDLLVSNGLLKDLRNNDFLNAMKSNKAQLNNNFEAALAMMPSTPVNNIVYKNLGQLKFQDISETAGFSEKNFSSGMASADLDNDGDMDIVINNSNGLTSVYENRSRKNNFIKIKLQGKHKNREGLGATVQIYYDNKTQISAISANRGYMSSSEHIAHFGLGNQNHIDSIVVRWDHMQTSTLISPDINQTLIIDYQSTRKTNPAEGDIYRHFNYLDNYKHLENNYDDYQSQVLLPHKLSQNGPFSVVGDFNSDGKDDLWVGGGKDQAAQLFLQNETGKLIPKQVSLFDRDKRYEDLGAVLFDLNEDGHQDIYVVSGSNEFEAQSEQHEDRIYLGNGKGAFSDYKGDMKMTRIDGQLVEVGDIDSDGDLDIFIGNRVIAHQYPMPGESKLLINEGGVLIEKSDWLDSGSSRLGLVTDALIRDIDSDGDNDIIVVGEWMPITIIYNDGDRFRKEEISIFGHESHGWWWSIEAGDFDGDGDLDLIAGNLGDNNKFKASAKNPFHIYSGDLDNNGDHDVYMAKTKGSTFLPLRGKECSTEEMPFISEKFENFDAFAKASLNEIFDNGQLNNALHREIKNFASIYLENVDGQSFKASRLNNYCQMGPMKDIITFDYNKDGNLDFIYGGKHFPVEVETVRYDASKGGICLGDGHGRFTKLQLDRDPVYLTGDTRDLSFISLAGKRYLLATANNGAIQVISLTD